MTGGSRGGGDRVESRVRRQRRTRLLVCPERYSGPVTTCDFCGRQEPDEAKTLTWTTAMENGRLRRYCDECSRAHLRAMEGKLDSEFW